MALAGVRNLATGRRLRDDRRQRFGTALAEALRVRGWNQTDLARLMGTTQSAVSAWITGKSLPVSDDVFEIEEHMDMTPGVLSKHLGYQPVDADLAPPDLETAITANPDLDDEAKEMMRAFYRDLLRFSRAKAKLTSMTVVAKAGTGKRAAKNGASPAPAPRSRQPHSQ